MAGPILEVRDLRVGFQTEQGLLTAVDDVDFTLEAGKTLGLVGESGCGKSVTAMSLMRLLPQPAGRILAGEALLEGRDLTRLPIEEMRKIRGNDIAMIFQEPMTALNPVHRVGRQIIEAIQLHEPMPTDKALRRAVELMEWVGIPAPDQRVNEYPHQLSGGMRQRVMIAIALSCHPKVLIADEPTTALDVTVQAQILDLIKRLQRETGMAVILITHDLGVVAETCDDVAVMYAGRIVERGPVGGIFAKPLHPYTQGLIQCLPKLDHPPKTPLPVIPGMVPGLKDMPEGCRFAARCPNKHSDDVLSQRQPWKECGSGHGVEACACFAAGLAISDEPPYSQPHEDPRRTNAPSTLESAIRHLRSGAGPGGASSGGEVRKSQREEQFKQLVEWAKASGKLISGDRWTQPTASGQEHRVYYDESRQRAIKVTNTGSCGLGYLDGEAVPALPLDYLERWHLQNEIFGDTVEFEGVMQSASGSSLVVSQAWLTGEVPTDDEISECLRQFGFQPTALPECYYSPSRDQAAMDCHDGNFVKAGDWVIPIDIIIFTPDEGWRSKLGLTS
ncbi:MAG: ATP-binding cassette domain-containing protein [Verrucomicrobiaceae bacterium]|jgi:peptide/nickel transport system ATP-binding protein|nr:ATP-binding cassette domain-containing protein [Verrucomicrobiaceae bacterium]